MLACSYSRRSCSVGTTESSRSRERDIGWWFDKRKRPPWSLVPGPLSDWLRGFEGDDTWELATGLRDGFTHRTVQRHITLTIGEARGYVHLEIGGARFESDDAMRRILTFGMERYSDFEHALASVYPLTD